MNKTILHRFFNNEALPGEKDSIRQWLESAPENYNELLKEREFFDALIFSGNIAIQPDENMQTEQQSIKKRPTSAVRWFRELAKIAAIVALLIIGGYYFYHKKMEEIRMAQNSLVVPAGQRANLTLPDGTNVWVNAQSEIKYPAYFSGSKREVELNGEAYFEVAYKADQPFIVHTGRYDIKVLGTTFNVESYENSGDFSTALINGSIKILDRTDPDKSIILLPDQKACLQDGVLSITSIEDYDHYRWKEGLICFSNTDFIDLMTRFEKCYGIRIVIENEKLSEHIFSGKFRISDGIDNALRVLQKDVNYNFRRDKDDSVIYIK